MHIATLEHVNITVSDPDHTATWLCRVFDWHIRWTGPSQQTGYTVHVGTKNSYLALYSPGNPNSRTIETGDTRVGLNHIALVVEDLDAIEKRVKTEGFKTHNHGDYEPGRRFYFHDDDGVEYEMVSYLSQKEVLRKQFSRQLGTLSKFGALAK